jgi:hypothetical protein
MSQANAEMEEKGDLDQNSFGSLFVLCLCRCYKEDQVVLASPS